MSDLTDFLLARIAEDEADVASVHDVSVCGAMEHGGMTPNECDCGWPEGLRDEYEAKLQIVEALIDMEPVEDERREQVVTLRWACEILALPYADHPDYREEWRP